MKVLAIEDQPVAGELLIGTLRYLGHAAELAENGAAAWSLIRQGGYRVIVSDWRMPGMDGLEICSQVRRAGGDYVYFILISSEPVTKENRRLALEAGVDDFLTKPIDPEELGMRLHVAERIIGLTAQVQQLEDFLPICSYCKKVRDDHAYWQEVERYFSQRQGTKFTHGICPACWDKYVEPELEKMEGSRPPTEPHS
jgi:DNA-binding response OmpR family regulator